MGFVAEVNIELDLPGPSCSSFGARGRSRVEMVAMASGRALLVFRRRVSRMKHYSMYLGVACAGESRSRSRATREQEQSRATREQGRAVPFSSCSAL
jgi:hypothetical protein